MTSTFSRSPTPQLRIGSQTKPKNEPLRRRCCSQQNFMKLFASCIVSGVALVAAYMAADLVDARLRRLEERVYFAPRDGLARRDYAWRYNGAKVVDSLTTPQVGSSSSALTTNSPFVALDDDLRPGRCWPILGPKGQLGIQLSVPVKVSHITIDHIPREIAHNISYAPRHVKVWGFLEKSHETADVHDRPPIGPLNFIFVPLATVRYDIHAPDFIQSFPVMITDITFHGVVAEILDNWGGDKTCLYRIRVHGGDSE